MIELGPLTLLDADGPRPVSRLTVEDGRIAAIDPGEELDPSTPTLCPGLIDLQVNGGGGLMLGEAESAENVLQILAAHRSLGTAAILPTLISDRPETTRRIIALVAEASERDPGILGLHLEGPHLTRPGAHDPDLLRLMSAEDLATYKDAAARLPHLKITLAPELVPPEQIRTLTETGILVSLGHSDCDYATASAAFAAGARMVTHLGNAMSGLHHRAPGLFGAALDQAPFFGLIADGIHVHDAVLRLALKLGPDRLVPVSDAMAVAGNDATEFDLQGRKIYRKNGQLQLADGTLAGADLSLLQALRHLAAVSDRPLTELLPLGFDSPARALGLPPRRIAPGAPADLLRITSDGRAERISEATWSDV